MRNKRKYRSYVDGRGDTKTTGGYVLSPVSKDLPAAKPPVRNRTAEDIYDRVTSRYTSDAERQPLSRDAVAGILQQPAAEEDDLLTRILSGASGGSYAAGSPAGSSLPGMGGVKKQNYRSYMDERGETKTTGGYVPESTEKKQSVSDSTVPVVPQKPTEADRIYGEIADRYTAGGIKQFLPRDTVAGAVVSREEQDAGAQEDNLLTEILGGVPGGSYAAGSPSGSSLPGMGGVKKQNYRSYMDERGETKTTGGYVPRRADGVSPTAGVPLGGEPAADQIYVGTGDIGSGVHGAITGGGAGRPQEEGDTRLPESDILSMILGGPDPFNSKPSLHSLVPAVPEDDAGTGDIESSIEGDAGTGDIGSGIHGAITGGGAGRPQEEGEPEGTSPEGGIHAGGSNHLSTGSGTGYRDNASRVSEDVMGQYAAMTGGRPSSAAISAATAASADVENALLQEILVGADGGFGGTNPVAAEVPEEYADYADLSAYETIVPMLESFESEEDMGDYLADMVNKGIISRAMAEEYLKRFDDPYEVYDSDGGIDYAEMVLNPGGWAMVNDGGTNFFGGLNRNMRLKAPNGQEFTVAQLYRLLKKNGMDASEAKKHLVKLQEQLRA